MLLPKYLKLEFGLIHISATLVLGSRKSVSSLGTYLRQNSWIGAEEMFNSEQRRL